MYKLTKERVQLTLSTTPETCSNCYYSNPCTQHTSVCAQAFSCKSCDEHVTLSSFYGSRIIRKYRYSTGILACYTFRRHTSEFSEEDNCHFPLEPNEWHPRKTITLITIYPDFEFDDDDLPF